MNMNNELSGGLYPSEPNGIWFIAQGAVAYKMAFGDWSPLDENTGEWRHENGTTIDAATVAAYVVASLEAGQVMTPPPF